MKRKLVQQGASTMMISLPSKWVKANNLIKGSEVDMDEKGKEIVISTSIKKDNEKKAVVDLSGYDLLINRVIVSLYLKGYEEVELIFKNREEMKKVKKHVLEELLGFEVIKQEQNKMIIRDLTGFEKQNIDDVIKRIFFVLDGMLEDLINAVNKKESLDGIVDLDSSINKLTHFSLRILNSKGYSQADKTEEFYGMISILEQIGDLIKQLVMDLTKDKLSTNQLEVIRKIRLLLDIFCKILFKFNKEEAVKFAKLYQEIKDSIKNKNKVDLTLNQINEAIIRMNNHLLVTVL
ncbi:MAG: hypothetical protein AABW73_01280 [Nanoarchaeota archaeon]